MRSTSTLQCYSYPVYAGLQLLLKSETVLDAESTRRGCDDCTIETLLHLY